MSECMEGEIREMLPDVLHGTLSPADRARIDAHLANCGPCRHELKALRAVHAAAVFTPSIDVESIVR
jgi:predicted anti-sigma-YlaC factor YlaD